MIKKFFPLIVLLFSLFLVFTTQAIAQAPAQTVFYNDAGVTVLVYHVPGGGSEYVYRKTVIPTGEYYVKEYAGHKFRVIAKQTGTTLLDYTTKAYNQRVNIPKEKTATSPKPQGYRVTLNNETNKVLEIYYLPPNGGKQKLLKTLKPGVSYDQTAYPGNKLSAKDKVTGAEYYSYVVPRINSNISITGGDVARVTGQFQTSSMPNPLKNSPQTPILTFINTTPYLVDVMEIDNNGKEYTQQALKQGDAYDQPSLKGEKWKVEVRATGAVLLTHTTKDVSETLKIRASTAVATAPKKKIQIKWLNMPSVVNSPNLKISAEIINSDNLDEIVFINDKKVSSDRITKEDAHGKMYIEIDATLSTGNNKIEMTVYTLDGGKAVAPPASVNYKKALTSNMAKPNVYFLGIGVSYYNENNFPSLEYADDDIIAVRDKFAALENSALYGNVKTKLILNEDATLNNIYEALSQFFNKASSTDYVVLMISSHGEVVMDDFYILPYDCSPNPNHFSFRAISSIDLGKYLKNVQASKMVFLDACHSGAAGLDIIEKSADATERKVNSVLKNIKNYGASSYIFSSSTGNQKSLQLGNVKHGVFTYALLMGMEGKSYTLKTDGNMAQAGETITPNAVRGVLMMDALREYVMEVVKDMTNGKQHPSFRNVATDPTTGRDGQGQDMPIYLIK